MVTACTNEENVTPCNGVPNAQPHGWHHLTVRVVPLLWQMGYQLLLCHLDLSICHVIDIVDYCGEVFAQLMTTFEVSVSFFLLLIYRNIHRVLVSIAVSIRISDTEVKNAQTTTLTKAMDAVISTLLVYGLRRNCCWYWPWQHCFICWCCCVSVAAALELLGLWGVAELPLLLSLSFVNQYLYLCTAHVQHWSEKEHSWGASANMYQHYHAGCGQVCPAYKRRRSQPSTLLYIHHSAIASQEVPGWRGGGYSPHTIPLHRGCCHVGSVEWQKGICQSHWAFFIATFLCWLTSVSTFQGITLIQGSSFLGTHLSLGHLSHVPDMIKLCLYHESIH